MRRRSHLSLSSCKKTRKSSAKMGKTIRTLPCHFRPFETGRNLTGEHRTLHSTSFPGCLFLSCSRETLGTRLPYAMGGESEDILTSFTFDDSADQNNYDRFKEKFDYHFTAKKNVICERAKFNQRELGQDEPVENFITDLYRPAEFCEYGSLRDEMILDRFVVGLRNDNLSEKLQINLDLTREQAVQKARQSENVKKNNNNNSNNNNKE